MHEEVEDTRRAAAWQDLPAATKGMLIALVAAPVFEVDAFYWTDWVPDIVNSRREEQGLGSL